MEHLLSRDDFIQDEGMMEGADEPYTAWEEGSECGQSDCVNNETPDSPYPAGTNVIEYR